MSYIRQKLLFFVFMMLPVYIFGDQGQDCADEKNCLSCATVKNVPNGPMVNLDGGNSSSGTCDQDSNITFNCASDEMDMIVGSLKNFEHEQFEQIESEIKDAKDAIALDVAKLGELIDFRDGWLQRLGTINLITNGDIEGLKNLDPERFDQDFSVEIDGSKLENNLDGRLESYIISGDNMLAWVLFKSATNKTKQDDEKTLEMLKILLENGVDACQPKPWRRLVDSKADRTYWIKNGIGEQDAQKFTSELPLIELAILYSFPAAVELLLEYGAKFIKKRVDFCIYCRIISDLTNCYIKKGISQDKLNKIKLVFSHFVDVLGGITFDVVAKDRFGQDVICKFDNMFCRHAAQACQTYEELLV